MVFDHFTYRSKTVEHVHTVKEHARARHRTAHSQAMPAFIQNTEGYYLSKKILIFAVVIEKQGVNKMKKISKSKIQEAVKRLADTYQPLKIYLFGSYAWGEPRVESDLDFLIVLNDDIHLNLALHIKGKQALKNMDISTDIVLNHQFFFTERAEHPSTLQHKIKTEGKLVYGNL